MNKQLLSVSGFVDSSTVQNGVVTTEIVQVTPIIKRGHLSLVHSSKEPEIKIHRLKPLLYIVK